VKYFLLETVGDVKNENYCFTDNAPRPIGAYALKTGGLVSARYPDGPGDVTWQLGEDYPGLQLTSFIGNTDSLLIVTREIASLVESMQPGTMEVVPFTLLNQKGRAYSKDYVLLNPIGTYDCVDLDKSECDRYSDGSLMNITKFVLAAKKLAGAPHLFRPVEAHQEYIFSEELVNTLRARNCTNFLFEELAQS